MNRPIIDWLNELPEPYKEQATANFDPSFSSHVDGQVKGLYGAIQLGFKWADTAQGHVYWEKLAENLAMGNAVPTESHIKSGTPKEWIETFPEPYREKALKNLINDSDIQFPDAASALSAAFSWSKSNEGSLYWYDFSAHLKGKTFAPKKSSLVPPIKKPWL